MLDLQKAFDTVDHDILCKELKAMGIKSVDWFRSYLSDRNQIVNVNDIESDMELSIISECKLLLYAEDSAILYSNKDSRVISDKLSLEPEMCSKWLVDNKLSLHMGPRKQNV